MWSREPRSPPMVIATRPNSAAKRSADFTWADGASRMKFRVSTAGVPSNCSGSRPSVVSIRAPNARSWAAAGSIGRRRSETSPSKRALTPAPAQAPRSIRAVDPEFMQSRVAPDSWRPSGEPLTMSWSPSRWNATPSAASASCVARTSRPGLRLRIRSGCAMLAAASSARCEIDLSPGTRSSPCRAPGRRSRTPPPGSGYRTRRSIPRNVFFRRKLRI